MIAAVYAWFALAALSTAYVAWDNFVRRNPEETVMKWGWVLITLYLGPLGPALYVLTDREPAPGTHEQFIRPLWKQAVGSTVHCVAGDATGIIVAAAVTAALGFPIWIDFIVEYLAGFASGLLIFQSLFMKDMLGTSYLGAIRATFVPEWLSMNMMATGMFTTMALSMTGRAMQPSDPLFWAVMSLGVIVGFTTAYPINVWMVARNMKHGLMTRRPGDRAQRAASHAHSAQRMRWNVTRPQLTAIATLTTLTLVSSIVLPAQKVNLSLGEADPGGVTRMPPGCGLYQRLDACRVGPAARSLGRRSIDSAT